MEKQYIISENELISLLAKKLELETLQGYGVDNWEGYGEGFNETIAETMGISEDEADDYNFSDAGKSLLKNYKEFKEK